MIFQAISGALPGFSTFALHGVNALAQSSVNASAISAAVRRLAFQAVLGISFGDASTELLINGAVGDGAAWDFNNCGAVDGKILFSGDPFGLATGTLASAAANATTYFVRFTVSDYVSGQVTVRIGAVESAAFNTNGRKIVAITTTAAGGAFEIRSSVSNLAIDDISVRPAGGPASLTRGAAKSIQANAGEIASRIVAIARSVLALAAPGSSLRRAAGHLVIASSQPIGSTARASAAPRMASSATSASASRSAAANRATTATSMASALKSATVRHVIDIASIASERRTLSLFRTLTSIATAVAMARRDAAKSLFAFASSATALAIVTIHQINAIVQPLALISRKTQKAASAPIQLSAFLGRSKSMAQFANSAAGASTLRKNARSLVASAIAIAGRNVATIRGFAASALGLSDSIRQMVYARALTVSAATEVILQRASIKLSGAETTPSATTNHSLLRSIVSSIIAHAAALFSFHPVTPLERSTAADPESRLAKSLPEGRIARASSEIRIVRAFTESRLAVATPERG